MRDDQIRFGQGDDDVPPDDALDNDEIPGGGGPETPFEFDRRMHEMFRHRMSMGADPADLIAGFGQTVARTMEGSTMTRSERLAHLRRNLDAAFRWVEQPLRNEN